MNSKKDIPFNFSERKILLRVFDLVFVFTSLTVVGYLFAFDYFYIAKQNWTWTVVLALYISFFGSVFEMYNLQKSSKISSILPSIMLASSFTVLFYLLTPFFTPFLPENRLQILYFYIAINSALVLWRLSYIYFITPPVFNKNVLLVGEISNIKPIINAFKKSEPNYKIIGFINCESKKAEVQKLNAVKEFVPSQLFEVLATENISEIVITNYNSENITSEFYSDLMSLLEKGYPIKEYTHVFEDMMFRIPAQFVGKDFYKYFPFNRSNKNKLYLFSYRFFDIFFAFLGILFGVLILPFVLFGNILANRGTLFYKQKRVGKNGKIFNIIKFRTMIKNAEKNGAVWASKNDVRATFFGRFMRRSRIDEIPQFINILKGEMSLIGPRPERPYFVEMLSETIPFYETRHIIKPGLTGWAQVKVGYGSSVDESLLKLQYDLYYIKHKNLFLDINIAIKTLSTMIFLRGQ